MKEFAVIGSPISHSLSPLLHNEIYRQIDFNASYKALKVLPEDLGEFLFDNNLDGFNVTIPHKISITEHLKNIDSAAENISAVNCVDNYIGYNTDWIGFLNALEINNIDLKDRDCLIIGAGGVAYAVSHALIKCQVNSISITNRSEKNKDRLLDWINKRVKSNPSIEPKVIINCTPIGMWPKTQSIPIDLKVQTDQIMIDTIYNPEETLWLQSCREQGAKTIGGLDMFIGQGIASINIWLKKNIINDINIQLIKNVIKSKLC